MPEQQVPAGIRIGALVAAIILVVVMIAQDAGCRAFAQAQPRRDHALEAVYLATVSADAAVTARRLGSGRFVEGNPLLPRGRVAAPAAVASFGALWWYGARRVRREGHPRVARWMLIGGAVAHSAAVFYVGRAQRAGGERVR